jgi:hypothetical protein
MMLDYRHELHICENKYILFCATNNRLTRLEITIDDLQEFCLNCKSKWRR